MNERPFVLGLDLGTGGVRAIIVEQASGKIIASTTAAVSSQRPFPGWSEQHPQTWWAATVDCLLELRDDSPSLLPGVAAVGLSGQMHGLVLLDQTDQPLRPCILWNDQRSAENGQTIEDRVGRAELIRITGKPALTGYTAPSLLWVRENEPETFKKIRRILLPKDFLRLRLGGPHGQDVSDASGTLLLDLEERQWSNPILSALDLDATILPPTFESSEVVGAVSPGAAAETGLPAGTPLVAGAGDQAAGGIACGIGDPSVMSLNLGTSGVVFATTSSCPHDPSGALHGFCHAVPNAWHVMGVMLSAGGSLRWYRDTLAKPGATFDDIIAEAAAVSPGANGLHFLPYLTGERTPHNDPTARALFAGISIGHQRPHFGRAVLEGILFGLRDGLELIVASHGRPDHIRMTGGGARSERWRQMAADIFQLPVGTVEVTDGSAYGAALLALVGSGRFESVAQAMETCVTETDPLTPSKRASDYESVYQAWRNRYPGPQ